MRAESVPPASNEEVPDSRTTHVDDETAPPSLPEVTESFLSPVGMRSYVDDVRANGRDILVRAKGAGEGEVVSIVDGIRWLQKHPESTIQIRYVRSGRTVWDTIAVEEGGHRLVRLVHNEPPQSG